MRLHDCLDHWGGLRPDAEFAVQGDRHMAYGEAVRAANQLANALIAAGLQTGDRIAILSKNSIEYVLLYFAAAKAGVAVVPLNCRLARPEWAYILGDARPRLLFAASSYLEAVDAMRGELPPIEHFLSLDAPGVHGWEAVDSWAADWSSAPPAYEVGEEDDVYQMYTSGTTGRPKGAVLTHGAVTANILQIGEALQLEPGERSLVVVPLFHAAAVPSTFSCIARGGSLVIQEDFKPQAVVQALGEEDISYAVLVGAMIQACLTAVPDIATRRYDALRHIYYGASPIAEETLRRAMEVFGCDFIQSYGMTEATQSLTFLSPEDHQHALRDDPHLLLSAGRAASQTEIRIVDGNDDPVPDGTPGEIVARGPQLMRGYWNRPDETAETLRRGWLHTGDIGTLGDGYLYVQDRLKDMIVSGGENVYPGVVEDALSRHPAVAEAAVIGVPDERWGETVKAVVVLRPGADATEGEIIAFCRGKLGGFELPRSVDFVDALPRTATGKVLKRALREPYWSGKERRVAGA